MKYKLICIDLDGTLLNSNHEISAFNQQVISQVKDKGIIVAIVTGRSYQRTYRYAEQIGIESPLICFNGGMIVDIVTGDILHTSKIDRAYAKKVIGTMIEAGCPAFVSDATIGKPAVYVENLGSHPGVIKYQEGYGDAIATCEGLEDSLWFDPIQILTMGQIDKMKDCNKHEELLANEDVLWVQGADGNSTPYLILFAATARKSFGLQWLCNHYNIKQEQVLAFGDYLNDIDMLEWAGCGVAMGNALPEVKAIADYITEDSDHDGVGKILQRVFLQNSTEPGSCTENVFLAEENLS